jgi:nucleoside-diphosphate-sugar epimerase
MAEVPGLEVPLGERRVRCLCLPGTDTQVLSALGAKVEIVEGDLTDPASVKKLCEGATGATVFHCAGIIHPTHGTRQFTAVNVEGTRRLVQEAEAAGARRMIHVSSNSPVGVNPRPDHVFDEQSPYAPYMGYGKSKMRAEEIVNAAGQRAKLETVIIRPPWFYGPGQPPRQSLFFEMIRDGKGPIVGGGENRRSMAYIDNICQGLNLCERVERARGGTFWIADRRPYSMNEIIDTVERVMEQDFGVKVAHERMRLPGVISQLAWLADEMLQGLGLYHQKIHVLSEMNKTIACSIGAAETELGYDPKIELAEGMRRSIGWMFENGQTL